MHKQRIHNMLEKIVSLTEAELDAKGVNADTAEMSSATDMIKDLCQAEMDCWKKCYYESIVKAMEEEDKKDELMLKMMIEEHGEAEGRMGYDRWRNSKGRFADKGHGHETSMAMATGRHGYMDPYGPVWYDQRFSDPESARSTHEPRIPTGRMGYTPDQQMPDRTGKGQRYDMYDEHRRHFHETGDPEQKRLMSEKGREYVDEALGTVRDIFVDADPQMQQKMKEDLFRLYREFGGK